MARILRRFSGRGVAGLTLVVAVVGGAIASNSIALGAVAACRCYCGKVLRPPCGDDACKQACGWTAPGGSGGGSTYDPEAERRREEAERQRRLDAERQRQRELEDQWRQEEEARKRRDVEFDRKKQDALDLMESISGQLGGSGGAGEAPGGLTPTAVSAAASASPSRQQACDVGNVNASVVDLRCLGLDPDKPILVDFHVVRGEERVFPAQVDAATLQNAAYQAGFAALMRFEVADAEAAVQAFRQAQQERPGDPMVRNGLLLAQDILRGRIKKAQETQAQARQEIRQSFAALMHGDMSAALVAAVRAREVAPKNFAKECDGWAQGVQALSWEALAAKTAGQKNAYKLLGHGLLAANDQNFGGAVKFLEAAQQLAPESAYIKAVLSGVQAAAGAPGRKTPGGQ